MAGEMEKIYADPEIGDVVLRKSTRARRISIRVHPVKGVSVSMPYRVPYMVALGFFKLKRSWVLETMSRQKDKIKDVPSATSEEIEALRRKAKAELPGRLAELAARHGLIYNKVTIKHNSTNWGSCSARNNINLNLNIVRLPRLLQDYILLHELCHLRHHDHGHAFHLLLEHVLTDNLMRFLPDQSRQQEGGETQDVLMAKHIAAKAVASKAKYPLDYTFTRAIKAYRLV